MVIPDVWSKTGHCLLDLVLWQEWSGMPEISDDDLKFWQELLGLHLSEDIDRALITQHHKTNNCSSIFFNVFV